MEATSDDGLSLQDLESELTELEKRKAELLRERTLYRRLGFSPERINFALHQVEIRQAKCQEALSRRLAAQLADTGPTTSAAWQTPRPG